MGVFEEKLWLKNQGEMSCQRKQGAGGTPTKQWRRKGNKEHRLKEDPQSLRTNLKHKPEQATCPPRPHTDFSPHHPGHQALHERPRPPLQPISPPPPHSSHMGLWRSCGYMGFTPTSGPQSFYQKALEGLWFLTYQTSLTHTLLSTIPYHGLVLTHITSGNCYVFVYLLAVSPLTVDSDRVRSWDLFSFPLDYMLSDSKSALHFVGT